jgi:hypothetical protein
VSRVHRLIVRTPYSYRRTRAHCPPGKGTAAQLSVHRGSVVLKTKLVLPIRRDAQGAGYIDMLASALSE